MEDDASDSYESDASDESRDPFPVPEEPPPRPVYTASENECYRKAQTAFAREDRARQARIDEAKLSEIQEAERDRRRAQRDRFNRRFCCFHYQFDPRRLQDFVLEWDVPYPPARTNHTRFASLQFLNQHPVMKYSEAMQKSVMFDVVMQEHEVQPRYRDYAAVYVKKTHMSWHVKHPTCSVFASQLLLAHNYIYQCDPKRTFAIDTGLRFMSASDHRHLLSDEWKELLLVMKQFGMQSTLVYSVPTIVLDVLRSLAYVDPPPQIDLTHRLYALRLQEIPSTSLSAEKRASANLE